MKTLHKLLLVLSFVVFSATAFSQGAEQVKKLIDQGVILNDSAKYPEAIAKYREALKIDSNSVRAQYELSYTLTISGNPKAAIPYLEKVTVSNKYPEAYDLIASIYDDEKDFEKSLVYYKQGLIAFPNYQRLHFNLAISYLRQKKYAEAETNAIDAIKLDPKHASSQRVYAMATYYQNKLGCSLLAWSSFLILEPQSNRSPGAYNFITAILHYGINYTGANKVTINISQKDLSSGNLLMPMTVLEATDNKANLSAVDTIELQMTALFKISHTITGTKEPAFVQNYFSDYFENLAKSGNMAAFARLVTLSAYKDENIRWIKDNEAKFNALDLWLRTTERKL